MSNVLTKNVTAAAGATTNIFTFPVPDNTVLGFKARCKGQDAADGESARYETWFTVKRFAAGAATLVGAAVPMIVNEDDAAWDMVVSVAGNDVLVDFTTGAGDTVPVVGELEFF